MKRTLLLLGLQFYGQQRPSFFVCLLNLRRGESLPDTTTTIKTHPHTGFTANSNSDILSFLLILSLFPLFSLFFSQFLSNSLSQSFPFLSLPFPSLFSLPPSFSHNSSLSLTIPPSLSLSFLTLTLSLSLSLFTLPHTQAHTYIFFYASICFFLTFLSLLHTQTSFISLSQSIFLDFHSNSHSLNVYLHVIFISSIFVFFLSLHMFLFPLFPQTTYFYLSLHITNSHTFRHPFQASA